MPVISNVGRQWETQLKLEGYRRSWHVETVADLDAALAWRDELGGADFWLMPDNKEYPCLAIRIGGNLGDMHFIPDSDSPGYRCLGGEDLPRDGITKLLFMGCDPGTGEEVPNECVVAVGTITKTARGFLLGESVLGLAAWIEL